MLNEIQSRSLGSDPYGRVPPWRREPPLARRRRGVSVVLFPEDSDEEHRRKTVQARQGTRALRRTPKGRKIWAGTPPTEEVQIKLLYLHLRLGSLTKGL